MISNNQSSVTSAVVSPRTTFAYGFKRKETIVIIDQSRREFIAKLVCDLGKTIFAVEFASYFFEKLPISGRILISIICLIMLLGSILILPIKRS